MNAYPWREMLLSCAVMALTACLLLSLFTIVMAALLIWS
jgi:hypothetical protein